MLFILGLIKRVLIENLAEFFLKLYLNLSNLIDIADFIRLNNNTLIAWLGVSSDSVKASHLLF